MIYTVKSFSKITENSYDMQMLQFVVLVFHLSLQLFSTDMLRWSRKIPVYSDYKHTLMTD
jgi:hypothetical protein